MVVWFEFGLAQGQFFAGYNMLGAGFNFRDALIEESISKPPREFEVSAAAFLPLQKSINNALQRHSCLDQSARVNPLLAAAYTGAADDFDLLQKFKKGTDEEMHDCIRIAVLNDHESIIKSISKSKIDWNEQDQPPLHLAVRQGSESMVQLLVSSRAPIDCVDVSGRTAVHVAVACEKSIIFQCLVKLGARVNLQDNRGWTPIMLAAARGNTPMLRLCVDAGANLTTAAKSNELRVSSPLHLCTLHNRVNTALELLALRADVHARDYNNLTPLLLSAKMNKKDDLLLMRMLLESSSDVDAVTSDGYTPLHFTAKNGNANATQLLLDFEANATIQSSNGATPFDLLIPKHLPEDTTTWSEDVRIAYLENDHTEALAQWADFNAVSDDDVSESEDGSSMR